MYLKRHYNHHAPAELWTETTETCRTCKGKGVVIKASLDGVEPCPANCDRGTLKVKVPPVSGIEVLRVGRYQNFSTRLVEGAQREGWLTITNDSIVIHGLKGNIVFDIIRRPGRYDDEVINHYECRRRKLNWLTKFLTSLSGE